RVSSVRASVGIDMDRLRTRSPGARWENLRCACTMEAAVSDPRRTLTGSAHADRHPRPCEDAQAAANRSALPRPRESALARGRRELARDLPRRRRDDPGG